MYAGSLYANTNDCSRPERWKIWGHRLKATKADSLKTARVDTMRTLDDGTKVINTTVLGKDITGYGGNVPLEIYVKESRIVKVKALKNA